MIRRPDTACHTKKLSGIEFHLRLLSRFHRTVASLGPSLLGVWHVPPRLLHLSTGWLASVDWCLLQCFMTTIIVYVTCFMTISIVYVTCLMTVIIVYVTCLMT